MPELTDHGDGIARLRQLDQRLHDDRVRRLEQEAANLYDGRDREGLLALVRRILNEPRAHSGQGGFATLLVLKAMAVLAILAGAVLLYQRHAEGLREEGRQEVRAENAARAIEQLQADARETQRRLERQGEAQREHQAQLDRARRDADAARVAGRELRDQLAAFVQRARDSAPGGSGETAGDPIGVLADVLRRADDRAGILAEYADRARIAGQLCERSYDSLTVTP